MKKTLCLRAVESGKAILSDVVEMYKFCLKKLLMVIIKIPVVEHHRPEVNMHVIGGTRLLQSMKDICEPYALATQSEICRDPIKETSHKNKDQDGKASFTHEHDMTLATKCCCQHDETNSENNEWVKPWTNRNFIFVPSDKDKKVESNSCF